MPVVPSHLKSMVCCRDFNEGDYEALLQLDSEAADTRPQISEAALRTLQTHVHMCGKAASSGVGCKPGKDTSVLQKVRHASSLLSCCFHANPKS